MYFQYRQIGTLCTFISMPLLTSTACRPAHTMLMYCMTYGSSNMGPIYANPNSLHMRSSRFPPKGPSHIKQMFAGPDNTHSAGTQVYPTRNPYEPTHIMPTFICLGFLKEHVHDHTSPTLLSPYFSYMCVAHRGQHIRFPT